jgi:hypothetical protein
VIAILRPSCGRHRSSLIDFVAHRELSGDTAAALHHLDRCDECRHELSLIALSVEGLRRLQRELEGVEPAEDAWPRLRARISRRTEPWRWRLTLGGLATSMMVVALTVAPARLGSPYASGSDGVSSNPRKVAARVEAGYISRNRIVRFDPADTALIGIAPIRLPPEIREVRKEVDSAKPSGRPAAPI